MSERSAFFDALGKELPNDIWGMRLKEELEAHLEDALYFAALEGTSETTAEERALADLGSPHLILEEFRHAMTYKSPRAFFVHAIAAGLLATPLVYLAMIGTYTIILALPIFCTLFVYYLFALAPILRHIDGRAIKGKVLTIVSGVPALLMGIPMIISLFGTMVRVNDRLPLLVSFLIGMAVTALSACTAAWVISWEQRHPTKPTTLIGSVRVNALRILGFVTVVIIVATLAMVQTVPSAMSTLAKTHFLISAGVAAPNALAAVLSPITAGWISGFVVTSTGLIALGFITRSLFERKEKSGTPWPWGWIIIALLTIPLVAFPPKVEGIKNIAWTTVPHTNISETIERGQLGPFYEMTKYVSQNQSDSFRYYVSQDDGMPLQVLQLPDRAFSLTQIRNVNDLVITAARYEISGATMLTKDVWCHWKNPTVEPFGPMDSNGNLSYSDGAKVFLQNGAPMYCNDLWVGDKEIFSVTSGLIDIGSSDITLSADGNWMLFKHDTDTEQNASLSPEEVYLIDLR